MHSFVASVTILFIFVCASFSAQAQGTKPVACAPTDRACLMAEVEALAPSIEKPDWKDQTYRELAKTYAGAGETDKAIALIPKIVNPDTRAMTIRGIGMAAAKSKWERARYDALWPRLSQEAKKIEHVPSQGIAYTYIAMAQAFAGDDKGARATAAGMTNAALRNKAYGETAEIEAERGDLANALASLEAIDSAPYRNKAYDTVAKIFLDKAMIAESYTCSGKIDNAYLRAKSVQRILDAGNGNAADETNLKE